VLKTVRNAVETANRVDTTVLAGADLVTSLVTALVITWVLPGTVCVAVTKTVLVPPGAVTLWVLTTSRPLTDLVCVSTTVLSACLTVCTTVSPGTFTRIVETTCLVDVTVLPGSVLTIVLTPVCVPPAIDTVLVIT